MGIKEKKSVAAIRLYKPAKTQESVCREYGIDINRVIKLAGNESRFGCSPKVIEALEKRQGEFSYYPDFNANSLRGLIAERLQVGPEKLIFGSGSFELISLIGAAFIDEGDEAIYPDPSFGWYINATVLNGGTVVKVPLDQSFTIDLSAIREKITEKTKVIWLCNPNNPTGTVLRAEELKHFVETLREDILLVLDEAYIDFIDEEEYGGSYIDTTKLLEGHDNLIILRTFSKSYGLASFRIGYGIADPKILESLLKVKLPINTTFAAQAAAEAAFRDEEYKDRVVRIVQEEKQFYYRRLENIGFHAIRSHGNFIFVRTGLKGSYVEESLLKKGIMIRDGTEFGFPEYVRISIGTHEENIKVIEALESLPEVGRMRRPGWIPA